MARISRTTVAGASAGISPSTRQRARSPRAVRPLSQRSVAPGSDQHDRYRQALAQALEAERLGFASIWMTEHHFTGHGITADNFQLLSYLAAETDHVRLGTAVSVLPTTPFAWRSPGPSWTTSPTAASTSALGVATSGRSITASTTRWRSARPGSTKRSTCPARLEGHGAVRQGAHWRFPDVAVVPRPYQRPHSPVWLATGSAVGVERAAREGWGVMLAQGQTLTQVGRVSRGGPGSARAARRALRSRTPRAGPRALRGASG